MYRFIEDEATADIAFEATGKTLEKVLESSALATTNVMVRDLKKVLDKERVRFSVSAKSEEMLLFKLLQEIIFYKDARQLLFSKYEIKLGKNSLECKAYGEKIDQNRHDLVVDVKAVTLHRFELKKTINGWRAHVILDI